MAEVETSRDGGVLTITLNRPDVLNAFTAEMHRQLVGAFKEARADDVRAVVVTGAGRGFCVGQDLNEFGEAARDIAGRLRGELPPDDPLGARAREARARRGQRRRPPAAGLSFACACDLRLAAESATFVPAFINIGLVPDIGRHVLRHAAARPGARLRVDDLGPPAERGGGAATGASSPRSSPDDRLAERAAEWAAELAAMPTRGVGLLEAPVRQRAHMRRSRSSWSWRLSCRPPRPGRRTSAKESTRSCRSVSRSSRADKAGQRHGSHAAPRSERTRTHPIRLVVNDDLQRNRLTVFFRLILAIPLFLWAVLWGVIALLAYIVNWFATLFMGRRPTACTTSSRTFLRYTTHVRAYTLLVADPYPPFTGKQGSYPIDLEIDPPRAAEPADGLLPRHPRDPGAVPLEPPLAAQPAAGDLQLVHRAGHGPGARGHAELRRAGDADRDADLRVRAAADRPLPELQRRHRELARLSRWPSTNVSARWSATVAAEHDRQGSAGPRRAARRRRLRRRLARPPAATDRRTRRFAFGRDRRCPRGARRPAAPRPPAPSATRRRARSSPSRPTAASAAELEREAQAVVGRAHRQIVLNCSNGCLQSRQ